MSQSQNPDSSKPDSVFDECTSSEAGPLRFVTIEQLAHIGELLDANLPAAPLEDWSNQKLGVPVLLVRRPEHSDILNERFRDKVSIEDCASPSRLVSYVTDELKGYFQ